MEHTMTHPVSVHSLQESGNATSNLDNNEFSRMDAYKSNKKHKEVSLKESHNYSTFNNNIKHFIFTYSNHNTSYILPAMA